MKWLNVAYFLVSALLGYSLKDQLLWIEIRATDLTVSLGWIIFGLMQLLFVAFKAGPAWRDSAIADLAFGGVHYHAESTSFFVELINCGHVDSDVIEMWIVNAVNSDGSESSKLSLPILVGTLSHGVIAKRHSTIRLGKVTLIDHFSPRLTVSGSDSSGDPKGVELTLTGFEWADSANRIYINLSISHASRRLDAWYELKSLSSVSPYIDITAVRQPLNEQDIRQQREKLGIPPAQESP